MGTIHERFVKQLDGSRYAGLNCTCASCSMGIFTHSLGSILKTAAAIRAATGDTSGGTNLLQIQAAAKRYGVLLTLHQGATLGFFYGQIRRGRAAIVQGQSAATIGTRWQASTTFRGNHAWYVPRGRGWTLSAGVWVPAELLVYDPLADGRRTGIARSPFWLPRSRFELFCRLLLVSGSTRLGPGKVYAALTRDVTPHMHSRFGGAAMSPLPTRLAVRTGYNIRTGPGRRFPSAGKTVLAWEAWQRTGSGELLGGSRVWYGNHSGSRWIHSSARRS